MDVRGIFIDSRDRLRLGWFLAAMTAFICTVVLLSIASATVLERWITVGEPPGNALQIVDDLQPLLIRVCAIKQYEDLSATWESDDTEREYCEEYVGQIGR